MNPDDDKSSSVQEESNRQGVEESPEVNDPLLAPYHRTAAQIEKMPIIEMTKTICPECKLIIDGTIYKDGDIVMIRKTCPEHGQTVEKYWEDYDLYMKMRKYNYEGRGLDNPDYADDGKNCPFDCGICERHKSHSGLINVVVTNRCHLSCFYCFFYAKDGEPIYEPTIDELDKMFVKLRSQKPIASNAIQLTGGEPTLRNDLPEIVKRAKQAGFDQIQLNTTGIELGFDPKLLLKLRHEGLSTLYMSFDGVSARTNPKNHWEVPLAISAARKAGVGIVLVPTVIRTMNDHDLGSIINFALNNIDVVRAINFQPVSMVGRMPARQREKQRITVPGAIKLIEQQTHGIISKDDWFSVPYTGAINKFLEALTGEYKYDLSTHFACGAGTYLFLDKDDKVIPITRFVDAAGLAEHLEGFANELEGKSKLERKLVAVKAFAGIGKFIDKEKQPKAVNFAKILTKILTKHDFKSIGDLQMKTLFLGMMHFQDEYNYDIKRVEKCEVHYTLPDGRVIPFCTFNVIPELYRDKAQREYAIPAAEWGATHQGWSYAKEKYKRNINDLVAKDEYKQAYGNLTDYFSLPVNRPELLEENREEY
ncbi:7,8-dihydro-6-hydroxymethylpterin dimethyltransferase [uncultured archaeon]|nr:7,8-dihydro-6-hydroxymethylpterin dimethyltransferase [uncultured archaeon]